MTNHSQHHTQWWKAENNVLVRGLRQRHSPSLLLFNIVLEVQAMVIRLKKKERKGIQFEWK